MMCGQNNADEYRHGWETGMAQGGESGAQSCLHLQ